MDAFKSSSPLPSLTRNAYDISLDFIRHGKHARAHQQGPEQAQSVPNDRSRREAGVVEEAKRQERAERERDEKAAAIKDRAHHTQAAEAIVKEERAAKDKMPIIKGLERYKLLDKMGECVTCWIGYVTLH
jgi:serine/threonine-protein kinase RCK2